MAPPNHPGGPLQSNLNNNSSVASPTAPIHQNQNQNAVNGNGRIAPPLHERSRNARAQARHRAKRKAYIEQLEETVTRLQAALSPYPLNSSHSLTLNGIPNDTSQYQSSFNVSASTAITGVNGNTLGSTVGNMAEARLRALELECNRLREYAEELRGLLAQHAPGVQVPPAPLPTTLSPTSHPTLHSSSSSSASHLNSNSVGSGVLPPLNSTFPSMSSTGALVGTYRIDSPSSGDVRAGVKRPRRLSDSCSFTGSGSGFEKDDLAEERSGMRAGDETVYSTPTRTPPLSSTINSAVTNKTSVSNNTPIHPDFPSTVMNGVTNASGRAAVSSLLSTHPQSQSGPTYGQTHTNTRTSPPTAYDYPISQSQTAHQLPASHEHTQQAHSNAEINAQAQPPMTPMPTPHPWGSAISGSDVQSHASTNNTHTNNHALQLPPPIPSFSGAAHLGRPYAFPLSAGTSGSSVAGTTRQDTGYANINGINSELNVGRSGRIGGSNENGNASGGRVALKREEDSDVHPPNAYGTGGGENVYGHTARHISGRQQHGSLPSISPTSATALSPALAFSAVSQESQHQTQLHSQIPSPHAHQHHFHNSTAQRLSPHPTQNQNHYHQQSHQYAPQHQQSTATLPSPQTPYSPIATNGSFRGYAGAGERYQANADHEHQHGQNQNQNQNQNQSQGYLWSPTHAGAVYGGR